MIRGIAKVRSVNDVQGPLLCSTKLKMLQLQVFVTVIVSFYRMAKFPQQKWSLPGLTFVEVNLSLFIYIYDQFHWSSMIKKKVWWWLPNKVETSDIGNLYMCCIWLFLINVQNLINTAKSPLPRYNLFHIQWWKYNWDTPTLIIIRTCLSYMFKIKRVREQWS
jgi:hypothetical protein